MSNNPRTQIWSSGGGTQSAAIAVLIAQGRLPKPDLAVIADTGYEKTSTWEYLDKVIRPILADAGVTVHKIGAAEYATVGLYAHNGDLLIPAYTTQAGQVSKLPTFCSNEWKARVVQRWAKRTMGVTQADCWIGISTDEMRRIRTSKACWWQLRYPLVFDVRLSRRECIELVEQAGLPTPPDSCCWMCPNQSDRQWANTKTNAPEDFTKAVEFEQEMQGKDSFVHLHKSAKPLNEVEFKDEPAGLFGCDSGQCMV